MGSNPAWSLTPAVPFLWPRGKGPLCRGKRVVHEPTTARNCGTALESGNTTLPRLAHHSAGKLDIPETGPAMANPHWPHWGAGAHHLAS